MKKTQEKSKKIEFETFREFDVWTVSTLAQTLPSVMNSNVRIRRYKVTVEEIKEPIEVLRKRLLELCRNCDNHHNWRALQKVARDLGMDSSLEGLQMGKDAK